MTNHFEISSTTVKRLRADPPIALRGIVEMDRAVVHALLKGGKVGT
jgi:hypothetical protein